MQSVSREESRHKHNKNPSTACTNSRGAGCENKHMDAVQRNKLNIHSVGTEMKSLAANMPNHRVQFTLLLPVWNVKYEGGTCSLQRCCWFLTAVVWLFLRRLQARFQLHLALRGSTSFWRQILKHCIFKVLSCRNSLNAVLWMLHLKGSFPII